MANADVKPRRYMLSDKSLGTAEPNPTASTKDGILAYLLQSNYKTKFRPPFH